MNPVARARPRPPQTTDSSWQVTHWTCFGIFLSAWALVWTRSWLTTFLPDAAWLHGVLVGSAAVTTLVALSRRLPGQNVVLAAIVIAVTGGAAHALSARTSLPFGPIIFTPAAGPRVLDCVPWSVLLLWIIVVLNSRGIARLILRPWRKMRTYGFWLIGVTAALCLFFDLGLEPFATRASRYWLWGPTKLTFAWHGAPISNFVGWIVVALIILAFTTPSLMKRRPAKLPPDYHPLIVWLLLNLLFLTATIVHQLWTAAGLIAAASVITSVFAVRGARW